jgi:hypothetical protein
LRKLQNVFELVVLAEACICGVHFEEVHDLAACSARLATRFPIRRAVRDAYAEASGVIRVLFSQLLATLRGPGKLPILFRAIVFLQRKRVYPERELGPALLTGRLKALNVASTSAEPEKCNWTRGIHRLTWREGVHDLLTQIVAIFLERLQIFPQNIYRYTLSCLHLHNCFHAYSMRSGWPCSQPPRADGAALAIRHLVRSVRVQFRTLIPPLFEDAVRVRASGELCRAAAEFGRTPEIGWTSVRVTQADPRGLQGRQLAPYVYTGAGRTSPIAILVNAILAGLNGLRLLAPAALLGDLANMIDASLAKAFGVLFEAPWMEASGFRSLDGVLKAVSGLRKALGASVYMGPTLGTCHPARCNRW